MKAVEAPFLSLISGPKQFIIPIYQRSYSWNIKQCEQLFNDILKTGKNNQISGHFIGSIVYISKGLYQSTAVPQLLVIDGQQRLTTLSLLLFSLSKILEKDESQKLINYNLINFNENNDLRYKLFLTKSDKDTFIKLIEGHDFNEKDSKRIIDNFKFFTEKVNKSNSDILLKGISKLLIIDVSLDHERDDPQLIFESLNSTGLELSQADLIRNYVLMSLPAKEQTELYEGYWFPMEQNFGKEEYFTFFDRFMRDYLTLKTGRIPNINEVYSFFKLYIHSLNYPPMEEIVEDIYKFSKFFVSIALGKEKDEELCKVFNDIKILKSDVTYPFILELYNDYKDNLVSKSDFVKIVKFIESYVFRRAICGIPTNSLNKTFSTLSRQIDKNNYLESFTAIMVLNDSYTRFPNNEEFKKELMIKDVYNFRSRNYLLSKLENHDRKEHVNVDSFTIEHVMPQNENLSKEWKNELGTNWDLVHTNYLHTIGNLTLTGYNSELSDKPFIDKKKMKGGFNDSPIRLNRSIADKEQWNEKSIIERANSLVNLAIKVWIYPEIDESILKKYKKNKKEKKIKLYDLKDHYYLKGKSLDLFEELRKRILNIDSSVHEEILKLYIAFKSVTNFVDIIPQKDKLKLSLNINFEDIEDSKDLCENVSGKGRWGNGNVEVTFEKLEDIDYIMFLIKQAYENVSYGEDNS
jgi:uncharacterized protein with ParB-like and HNH nuclease domain/predicted transport protein